MGFRYGAVFAIIRAEESTDLPLNEFLRSAHTGTCRSRGALGISGHLISAGLRSARFGLGERARLGVTTGGFGLCFGAAPE
ncbi:MAG TPA: hypothetical protein DDZ82_08595 [Rhodobacteraceae bacterium]|nr:hypothetical protein [Paracoccaceae bacterium]